MGRLTSPGLYLGGSALQAVPLPNGTVHKLNTAAGAATTPELHARTKAVGLTLTDPHWLRVDGETATAGDNGEFKVPAGFSFWPLSRDAVAVSLYPEGGSADTGDFIQSVGEYL